jgi:hypothetical protein
MQPESIVLIPPTHEQSNPSFHLAADELDPFLEFLREKRVALVGKPPASLGPLGPNGCELLEIEAEAGSPMPRLEGALREFLARREVANLPNPD